MDHRETCSMALSATDIPSDLRRREPVLDALSGAFTTLRQRFLRYDKMAALVARMLRDAAADTAEGPVRFVDVGCAEGGLALRITARLPRSVAGRLEPIGIEVSKYLAHLAHLALDGRGGRCIQGAAVDGLDAVERGSVHVIALSRTLEHETSPLSLLRLCRERLALDGRIVVRVPNHACVGRRLRGSGWYGCRRPDHVASFTPETLAALARAAGLRVVRMNAFDRSPLSDSLYAVLGRDVTAVLEAVAPAVGSRQRKAA
jgi:SAM-dependent methyltransferase